MSMVKVTYIQGQVEAQDVTFLEQRLKVDILSLALLLQLRVEARAVEVTDLHAKSQGLLGHVAADTAHAQDSKDLALGIVTEARQRVSAPLAGAEAGHAHGQVAHGTQEQEHANVGRGVVDGRGGVGNENGPGAAVGAGGNIDLVIASA